MVLMDDPGKLLPHLPAPGPPQLLDLAASGLMGHKLHPVPRHIIQDTVGGLWIDAPKAHAVQS
jgi:hypothetical protein